MLERTAAITDRRITATGLAKLLGRWERPGSAYVALADAVRATVMAGSVPLSTRMPSERDLAAALGVSRTTTTAAYGRLRDEGFLVSRQGSGTVTTLPSTRTDGGGPGPWQASSDTTMIDLSGAAPQAPEGLHAACLRAIDALPRHLATTGYHPAGLPELREVVAQRFTDRGTPTTADQILITTGAQQAIALLARTHLDRSDRAVVEHPSYPHAIAAIRATGARAVPVPVGPDGLDVDLLESTIHQTSPRLVYLIPDHQNPTGTCLADDQRARVRELAARHRVVLVGDETLSDLTLDGPDPEPFAGDGTLGAVVVLGSASKPFWGGLRVGWVRAHPAEVARLATARAVVDIATSLLDQLVVRELFSDADLILPARRAELRERRDLLVSLLRTQLPSWRFNVPRGGAALWVDLGVAASSAYCALALRHGVQLAAGPTFGVDGSFENRLRVPFTTTPDLLADAVPRLAAAWATLTPSIQRSGAPATVV